MEKTDNLWTQLFPDKSIPEPTLQKLQHNIMAEILSHPLDFAAIALLARRRRWGAVFAGSCLGLGVAVLLLFWFQERAIAGFFTSGLSYVNGFFQEAGLDPFRLFSSWLAAWGEGLFSKLKFFFSLRLPVEFLWQEYSWQLTGLAVLAVLFTGGIGSRPRRIIEEREIETGN